MRGIRLVVASLAIGMLGLARVANAQSDELVIKSAISNGVIFDHTVLDTGPAPLVYVGNPTPGSQTVSPVTIAQTSGTSVLFLTLPFGQDVAGGIAPVQIPSTTTYVTDALVATGNTLSNHLPQQFLLIPTGDPDLAALVAAIGTFSALPQLTNETGTLQDVTPYPAATFSSLGPIDVFIQSNVDVVPEPASLSMLGLGSLALLARRRRA